MTAEKTAVLERAIPILAVADLMQAFDYYERVLGFQVGWKLGEPPNMGSVYRDQIELYLSQPAGPKPGASSVYFRSTGVDAYFNKVTVAGAKLVMPIADRPYGMRDFRIVDPDGNELSFGEVI